MTQPPPSSVANATALPAFVRLLAWCLVCAGLPVLVLHASKSRHPAGPAAAPVAANNGAPGSLANPAADGLDVPAVIARLRAEQPEYIGIGNSMMFTRLGKTQPEIAKLNEETGHKFFLIQRGGSTSAAWYLTLKNVVAASGVHPKLVFFFVRDTELTSPYANTIGIHAAYLKSLRSASEPVVDDLLRPPAARDGWIDGTVDRVSGWLTGPKGLYFASVLQDRMQQRVSGVAMKIGGGKVLKAGNRRVLTERFGLDHLRYDVPADMAEADGKNDKAFDPYQSLSVTYIGQEERSFLPPLMEVAKEHGLKLLFFRIKRRPELENGVVTDERSGLHSYVKRLQHWIEERGGLFYDETYDPAIRLEAYNDGDHIADDHRDWYRKYFWQRMSPLFP